MHLRDLIFNKKIPKKHMLYDPIHINFKGLDGDYLRKGGVDSDHEGIKGDLWVWIDVLVHDMGSMNVKVFMQIY